MNELQARVISQEKGIYRIQSGTAVKTATVSGKYRYEAQTIFDYPAVGDYVLAAWPGDGSDAVITGLLPRKSCFLRKAAGTKKQEQIVAANIDIVFICMSLNNNFNIRRLERYLSVAYDSGAAPVVVLTKSDLCPDVKRKIAAVQNAAPGADVLAISSLAGDYEAVISYILPGRTVAFIGSSGVGKSTLINKLTGIDSIATSEIGNDDKGRHTTTHRELITLSNGAFVIDTPGMRELGMWDSGDGIDTAFADIEELSRACKYADCTHTSEPGCAVLRAIEDGTLDAVRLREASAAPLAEAYHCGGLTLDTASHEVCANGVPVQLTRTEYAILKLLMQNPGQVLAKSVLLDRISADTPDCTESSLKTHISNLRGKLRAASGEDPIESVWGIGFRLNTES